MKNNKPTKKEIDYFSDRASDEVFLMLENHIPKMYYIDKINFVSKPLFIEISLDLFNDFIKLKECKK